MSPLPAAGPPLETLSWHGDSAGYLSLLDQTRLPTETVRVECHDAATVWEAIRVLRVRGAPAIGIAAAYGLYLGVRDAATQSETALFARLEETAAELAASRPTAVNLGWALDRMKRRAADLRGTSTPSAIALALWHEAAAIHDEDRRICRAIGQHGAALFRDGDNILTHCNAGGLATSELGTALAAIVTAHAQGKRLHVWVDETRPLLQGARLTAWELQAHGIPATLICDSMAAQVMREGRVQAVIVGADRIAANGDTANKIGTYGLALLAAAHNLPFHVAAPISTFDLSLATGEKIPIEQRPAQEITQSFGQPTAPPGIAVYNPAFDVTPARLIQTIVCERGAITPVTGSEIRRMVGPSA